MEGRRKSTRKTKPTPRYIAWRGLRILTASREQASLSHTLPTDSCRVLEWVTEHSSYGLRSLLPIEDNHGDSRDETVNIDEQMVAEPDVVHGEEAFQPVTQQLAAETDVLRNQCSSDADVHLELPETGHAVRAASPVTTAAEIDADVHLELSETGHAVCAASPVTTAAEIAADVHLELSETGHAVRAASPATTAAEIAADVHLELSETGHAVRAASPATTAAEIDADVHLELPETGHVVCAASPVSTAAEIAAEVVEYSNSNDSEVFPYVGVPNFSVFLKAQPEKINAEDDVSIVSQTAERNRRDNPKVFVLN